MVKKENAEWAENMLREKQKQLGRIPKKDDFDEITRSRIKAFLGPWPRALESAGLKIKKEKSPSHKSNTAEKVVKRDKKRSKL